MWYSKKPPSSSLPPDTLPAPRQQAWAFRVPATHTPLEHRSTAQPRLAWRQVHCARTCALVPTPALAPPFSAGFLPTHSRHTCPRTQSPVGPTLVPPPPRHSSPLGQPAARLKRLPFLRRPSFRSRQVSRTPGRDATYAASSMSISFSTPSIMRCTSSTSDAPMRPLLEMSNSPLGPGGECSPRPPRACRGEGAGRVT